MMSNDLEVLAEGYFSATGKIALSSLLQAIPGAEPSGEFLRYDNVYQEIRDARRSDETNEPVGVWQHEMKIADWPLVSELCTDALSARSKDLQLAVWLLESGVHQYGFAALAPNIFFIKKLCEQFWNDIYPRIQDDDLEYRTNVLDWLNVKLLPILRLLPLTQAELEGGEFCWFDLQRGDFDEHDEELRSANQGAKPVTRVQAFQYAMGMTHQDFYLHLYHDLGFALLALDELVDSMSELCGDYAQSFASLHELLLSIYEYIQQELNRRGAIPAAMDEQQILATEQTIDSQDSEPVSGIKGRQDAYRSLEQAARFLMGSEPHSPVPYLVLKACEWGRMDTRQLYQHLFVNAKGQISIFDIVGVTGGQEN